MRSARALSVRAKAFYQKLRDMAAQPGERSELQRAEAFLATNQ